MISAYKRGATVQDYAQYVSLNHITCKQMDRLQRPKHKNGLSKDVTT